MSLFADSGMADQSELIIASQVECIDIMECAGNSLLHCNWKLCLSECQGQGDLGKNEIHFWHNSADIPMKHCIIRVITFIYWR